MEHQNPTIHIRAVTAAPIAAASVDREVGVNLTTVQETSKRLKAEMLLVALSLSVGIVWVILAVNASDVPPI